MPATFSMRFRLPKPLLVSATSLDITIPSGKVRVEFTSRNRTEAMDRVLARADFSAESLQWERTLSGAACPGFVDSQNAALDPIREICLVLARLLEFAAIEAESPHVAEAFLGELSEVLEACEGTDSKGQYEAFGRPHLPVFVRGHLVSSPQVNFGSPLSIAALSAHLADPRPYWRIWLDGYYALLSHRVGVGTCDRLARECLLAFQTAMETACLVTQEPHGWERTSQYSYDPTIKDFPEPYRPSLAALLLTRNNVLHRGRLIYKELGSGERWADARKRSDDNITVTAKHLQVFANTTYDAITWLEDHPKKRVRYS